MSEPSGVAQLKEKEDGKVTVSNNNNSSSNIKCNIKKVLLLGSSHGRGLRERLHSILGDEYMVTNIFKPNATYIQT
jgi:trans-2-enoyl-CoA reductase